MCLSLSSLKGFMNKKSLYLFWLLACMSIQNMVASSYSRGAHMALENSYFQRVAEAEFYKQQAAGKPSKEMLRYLSIICQPVHCMVKMGFCQYLAPLVGDGYRLHIKDGLDKFPIDLILENDLSEKNKIETIKELFRLASKEEQPGMAAYFEQKAAPELFEKIKYVTDPGWPTKTWRSQVMAFLMTNHPRAGSQVKVHLNDLNVLKNIAYRVPQHMSVEERRGLPWAE